MKKEIVYIFPMNYRKKEKFLGIVEYKNLAVIGVIGGLIFLILKGLDFDIAIKISVFLMLMFLISAVVLIGINGENMLDFLYFVLKFLFREKVYLYRKTVKKGGGLYEKINKIVVPDKKY